MDKITKQDLDSLLESLGSLFVFDNEEETVANPLIVLLGMDDKNFELIAPGIIQSFQQTLNSPNNKLFIAQSMNANGTNLEDLVNSFEVIMNSVDKIEDVSTIKKDFLKQILASLINTANETEGISKRYISIPIEFCHPDAKMPKYANISDSGMDVYALEDYTINPGETKLIPTGIKLAIPTGYEIQVRPKSGRALKTKLRIANTPGTVDAGYRDEICVIVENVEPPFKDISYEFDENGKPVITSILHGSSYTIGKGEKFCQLVLSEVPKAIFYQVEKVSEIGENRGGGFGSTGLH